MKIRIVCVGKMKEDYFLKAQAEYAKRLSRFASLEIIELADERTPDNPTEKQRQAVLKKEGERVKKAVAGFDILSVLAIEGEQSSSEGFAKNSGKRKAAARVSAMSSVGLWGWRKMLSRRRTSGFRSPH